MNKRYLNLFATILLYSSKLFSDEALMEQEIKHVVILMQENRSFDNVLAWLYENDHPHHFIPATENTPFLGLSEETLPLYINPLFNSKGEFIYSCTPLKGLPSLFGQSGLNSPKFDPNETFPNVTNQIYGFGDGTKGTMAGFLQNYATLWNEKDWVKEKKTICAVMETYTSKELPVLCGLGKHYAVSDLWFASVPTQTNPNRAFCMCGTSDGQVINGNLGHSIFQSDTLWNRLSEQSPEISWNIFWQSDLLQGVIKGPASGPKTFPSLNNIPYVDEHFLGIDEFHKLARKGELPAVSFLEPQWTISENADFDEADILRNKDLLIGLQGNDLHPPGDVRTGENFVANIYTSLIANEDAWNQTLFVIVFDEHGGLFDHVVPPPAIAPDHAFQNGFKFDRYGVRVPAIFISPKIQKKTILRSDKQEVPFDHTSLIATLFKWKNIPQKLWNMGRRTAIAPTFDSVITLTTARKDAALLPEEALSQPLEEQEVIKMGDLFSLKAKEESYIQKRGIRKSPTLGKEDKKATFHFSPGSGKITHGSFVCIHLGEPDSEESQRLLEVDLHNHNCSFGENCHESSQWWTIKSVDHPYLGYEIRYGDKIYLENHIYVDLIHYLPSRLAKKSGIFSNTLNARSILEEDCAAHYWTIEKP